MCSPGNMILASSHTPLARCHAIGRSRGDMRWSVSLWLASATAPPFPSQLCSRPMPTPPASISTPPDPPPAILPLKSERILAPARLGCVGAPSKLSASLAHDLEGSGASTGFLSLGVDALSGLLGSGLSGSSGRTASPFLAVTAEVSSSPKPLEGPDVGVALLVLWEGGAVAGVAVEAMEGPAAGAVAL